MSSAPHTATARVPGFIRRRLRPLVLLALLAAAASAAFLLPVRDGSTERGVLQGPSDNPFTLRYPPSWRLLGDEELELLPGKPLAALRRKGNTGFVVVRREKGRAGGDLTRFAKDLSGRLKKDVPDFKGHSTKLVKTRAGKALFLSYVRTRRGSVHSLVIVPSGLRTFTLNTASPGRATRAALEIASMIRSFDARR